MLDSNRISNCEHILLDHTRLKHMGLLETVSIKNPDADDLFERIAQQMFTARALDVINIKELERRLTHGFFRSN